MGKIDLRDLDLKNDDWASNVLLNNVQLTKKKKKRGRRRRFEKIDTIPLCL